MFGKTKTDTTLLSSIVQPLFFLTIRRNFKCFIHGFINLHNVPPSHVGVKNYYKEEMKFNTFILYKKRLMGTGDLQ